MTGQPIKSEPWLLLGERRRQALCTHVRCGMERWVHRWFATPDTVAVSLEQLGHGIATSSTAVATRIFEIRGVEREWLATLSTAHSVAAVAAQASSVEAAVLAEEGSLASALDWEIIKSLWDELQTPGLPRATFERSSAESQGARRGSVGNRSVVISCQIGDPSKLSLQWTLSPVVVAGLLNERRVAFAAERVLSRRSALPEVAVPVECEIGSIQITVRDLHALRVGDVLLTELPLDTRAQFRVRGNQNILAEGQLGQSSGFKAIQIETANRGHSR